MWQNNVIELYCTMIVAVCRILYLQFNPQTSHFGRKKHAFYCLFLLSPCLIGITVFHSTDYRYRSLICFIFCWTEKDAPRSGERGRGREEQNHRELEDGSEDTTHEVNESFFHLTLSRLFASSLPFTYNVIHHHVSFHLTFCHPVCQSFPLLTAVCKWVQP